MRLNNKYITSIDCLRNNFNFYEAWHKIDVLIRDLSPSEIYYESDDEKYFYNVISSPQEYKFENSCLHGKEGDSREIDLSPEELSAIEGIAPQALVRIIALAKLAKQTIPQDLSTLFKPINLEDSCIILRNGANLQLKEHYDKSKKLVSKPIKVPLDSNLKSFVGGVELEPGQCTFGVFSGNDLVAVSPRQAQNNKYHLSYEVRDGQIMLVAIERSSGLDVALWPNASFFTLVGENNFAFITGTSVYSQENEDLNNHLRREIKKAFRPRFLKYVDNKLIVVYSNGNSECFQV